PKAALKIGSTPQRAAASEHGKPLPDSWFAGAAAEMPPAEPSGLFALEADDSLIQELLAGIPSTAWLPTDPLTSEDWFPDPASSVITQDYSLLPAEQPDPDAVGEAVARAVATTHAAHAGAVGAGTDVRASQSHSADVLGRAAATGRPGKAPIPEADVTLDTASSHALQPTPDARLLAGVRSKRGTTLVSRSGSKRGNPLSGFAKKHGIGYPVGNQMAILSPELLSSSPPNATQLRKNPYKYYSPPKHLVPRPTAGQAAGRNLMLGVNTPRASQSQRAPSSSGRSQPASARRPRNISGNSTHSSRSHGAVPGAQARLCDTAKAAAKWEIGQDKLLLRGVRYHRWRDGLPARDPSRFVADDWEQISLAVSAGGIFRSARQCRRRWAVMFSHLGSTIMEFVDSAPTPQSSAQSTPAPPGSAASGAPDPGPEGRAPQTAAPLEVAPHPPSELLGRSQSLGLELASLISPADFDIQSLDVENRWATPAYCQLLTDIVHAITNPGSRAAEVVRKGASATAKEPSGDTAAEQTTVHASSTAAPERPKKQLAPATPAGARRKTTGGSVGRVVGSSQAADLGGMLPLPLVQQVLAPSAQHAGDRTHADLLKAAGGPAGQLSVAGALSALHEVLPRPAGSSNPPPGNSAGHVDMGLQVPAALPMTLPGVSGAGAILASQPASSHAGGGGGAATGLETVTSDQDMNVYMEFIRSLAADQGDLSGTWSSLFEDPGNCAPAPSQSRSLGIDDDDANDGDFVLEDSEDVDDDDDDDGDYDAGESEQPTGQAYEDSPRVGAMDALGRPKALGTFQANPASSNTDKGNSWELALRQLGLEADGSPAISFADVLAGTELEGIAKLPSSSGSTNILADPLIQQLMQGVNIGGDGGSSSVGHAAWLSSMAIDPAALPQWSVVESSGTDGDLIAAAKAPSGGRQAGYKDLSLAEFASGASGAPDPAMGSAQTGKAQRHGGRALGVAGVGGSGGDGAEGRAVHRTHSHQSHLQRLMSDIVAPSKRGAFKPPRKLMKKPASASIVKALSAAVMMDMDGFSGLGSNAMDTEMSGLYQDALQEGEDIGVQEESLSADNCEYLFTADQMSQLREQQIQNFQFVMQAFLISCAEVGPHTQRARHWKKQLDQLALWHSLGTREAPSDLMSADGLKRFGSLIESAERQRASTGTVGMTECGRFAPNPASFFAIPGITAVIPDIYEAVDEIHRATQLSADHDPKGGDGSGGGGADATKSGARKAAAPTVEMRSFDRNMDFTTRCQCTPIAPDDFKSALMLGSVFPRMYLQMRNGKRKAEEEAESPEDKVQVVVASGGSKQMALLPAGLPRADGGGGGEGKGHALLPGMKPLAPLVKPGSRTAAGGGGAKGAGAAVRGRAVRGNSAGGGGGGSGLPAIMPMVSNEGPPAYTAADVRVLVEEMKSQMRAFRRDIHRVPRSRRRIFVQGDDGVPRLDWMKMKIDPLVLPPAMHFLLAPLLSYSGFKEAMLPRIVAVRKPKNRIHFLETEDALLFLGLRLFGLDDVASMRVHLLPCKTASQLRNRMNNLRARRAPQNPVKEYCLRRITPFTLEEEEILRVGVLVYGDEFQQMNQNLLVNRPLLALTHMWQHARGPHESAATS
ncbi:hypothetical protein LPJ61_000744, partial [Coemansia biformis]